jgi:hypothetical protein
VWRDSVLPHSNETFVPAAGLLISIYVWPGAFLPSQTGAGVGTGEPQSENACGSFSDGYQK